MVRIRIEGPSQECLAIFSVGRVPVVGDHVYIDAFARQVMRVVLLEVRETEPGRRPDVAAIVRVAAPVTEV